MIKTAKANLEKYCTRKEISEIIATNKQTETGKIVFEDDTVRSSTKRAQNSFVLKNRYKLIISYSVTEHQKLDSVKLLFETSNSGNYTFNLTELNPKNKYISDENNKKYCVIESISNSEVVILINTDKDAKPSKVDTFTNGSVELTIMNINMN